jgi:hypothetical protein
MIEHCSKITEVSVANMTEFSSRMVEFIVAEWLIKS